MENIGISAKCPCCGSKNTVREDVDAFDEGWNIVVSIYNVCRDCNADFLEEVVYREPAKYTIVPADEVGE
jgi:hypothetical protein